MTNAETPDESRAQFAAWPRPARLLWAVVTVAGMAACIPLLIMCIVVGLRELEYLPALLFWIAVGSYTGWLTQVTLPVLGRTTLSNGGWVFALALLFPPHWAVLGVGVVSALTGLGAHWRVRAYGVVCATFAMTVARFVLELEPNYRSATDLASLPVALAAGAAYFSLSHISVAVLDMMADGRPSGEAMTGSLQDHGWSLVQAWVLGLVLSVVWLTSPWMLAPIMLLTIGESQSVRRLLDIAGDVRRARHETLVEQERARTDGLTGLLNRRAFDDQLRQLPPDSGILMLDLDHFKHVNDTYGHQVGDRVLKAAAAALRQSIRPSDFCARYGGEELCVLLEGVHSTRELTDAGERIREAVAAIRFPDLPELVVTISIGGSAAQGDAPAAILQRADRALYQAKHDGRNRVFVLLESFSGSVRAA